MPSPLFDVHFAKVYGERWPGLRQALLASPAKCARRNLFFPQAQWQRDKDLWVGEVIAAPNCYELKADVDWPHLDESLRPFYRMDPASVFAGRALGVEPGERVLDMCAAPGGKSLILFEALCGLFHSEAHEEHPKCEGELILNELSAKRRHRLMSVVKTHVPKHLRGFIQIRGQDGSRMGLKESQQYDRVLLDAPCSGERGLMEKPQELSQWKAKRSQSFAIRQYALLASAFQLLKPGGRLVYSTCSISAYENDGVIAKLIKKRPKLDADFEIIRDRSPAEPTEFGHQFLPDGPNQGWGPIYYAVIRKLDESF